MTRFNRFLCFMTEDAEGNWCKHDHVSWIIGGLKKEVRDLKKECQQLQDKHKSCSLECESKSKEIDSLILSNLESPSVSVNDCLTDNKEINDGNPSTIFIVIGIFTLLAVTISLW